MSNAQEVRRAIWARYARLLPSGEPMRCRPSPLASDEDRVRRNGGTDKIIFDYWEAADWARKELAEIYPEKMRVYPCKYSKKGHYHLATEADDD